MHYLETRVVEHKVSFLPQKTRHLMNNTSTCCSRGTIPIPGKECIPPTCSVCWFYSLAHKHTHITSLYKERDLAQSLNHTSATA